MFEDETNGIANKIVDRIKTEIYWINHQYVIAKKRKRNRISFADRITYDPYVCDYYWNDAYGGRCAKYRFYCNGLVCSLYNDADRFFIPREQIEGLKQLLKENWVPYMGSLNDYDCFDGCSYYIYFFDRYGRVVTKAGGSNPTDDDFLEVVEYIEQVLEMNSKPKK